MSWLFIIISAYFLFAINSLLDRYLLIGKPNPRSFAFYTGSLGMVAFLLAPLIGFSILPINQILLDICAGAFFVLGLFALYTAAEKYEISRVAPVIGGILPIITLIFTYLESRGLKTFSTSDIIALGLLVLGSIFISLENKKGLTVNSFPLSALAALLFAIFFIFSKIAFNTQLFGPAFLWMRIGGLFTSLSFLVFKDVRKEILGNKPSIKGSHSILFLISQISGGSAFLLQTWATILVPFSLLPFINALESTKYIFILVISGIVSLKWHNLLGEEFTPKIFGQKIIAILLITTGVIILAFLKI